MMICGVIALFIFMLATQGCFEGTGFLGFIFGAGAFLILITLIILGFVWLNTASDNETNIVRVVDNSMYPFVLGEAKKVKSKLMSYEEAMALFNKLVEKERQNSQSKKEKPTKVTQFMI